MIDLELIKNPSANDYIKKLSENQEVRVQATAGITECSPQSYRDCSSLA